MACIYCGADSSSLRPSARVKILLLQSGWRLQSDQERPVETRVGLFLKKKSKLDRLSFSEASGICFVYRQGKQRFSSIAQMRPLRPGCRNGIGKLDVGLLARPVSIAVPADGAG